MKAYQRYGIAVGQVYVPADGSKNRLTVVDVEMYADVDDVVVCDEIQGRERRIDAFKLAKVRYCLVQPCTLWSRFDQSRGEWDFNHLSDGHEGGDKPTPKCSNHQSVWSKGTWQKQHAWLMADEVRRVIHL